MFTENSNIRSPPLLLLLVFPLLTIQFSVRNKVLAHEKIDVIWYGQVEKFEGSAPSSSAAEINADGEVSQQQQQGGGSGLEMVRVRITNSHGTIIRVPCKAAFVAVGHDPINHFLDQLGGVDRDAGGYLVTAEGGGRGSLDRQRGEGVGSTMTSVPGLFAAGDAADAVYRQVFLSLVLM
jgi:thioredoxin reductase